MRILLRAAAGAAALAMTAPSGAAIIENDTGIFTLLPSFFELGQVGQSFTAVDTELLSISLRYRALNPSFPNDAVTISLRQGAGVEGALLAARSFVLPLDLPTDPFGQGAFIETDFSGTFLSTGQVYTFVLTSGSNPRISVDWGYDSYGGGSFFGTEDLPFFDCGASGETCDLNFRVAGRSAAPAVPEPAQWAMLVLGFGAVGGGLRLNRLRQVRQAA